jgi:hypothetical protein
MSDDGGNKPRALLGVLFLIIPLKRLKNAHYERAFLWMLLLRGTKQS